MPQKKSLIDGRKTYFGKPNIWYGKLKSEKEEYYNSRTDLFGIPLRQSNIPKNKIKGGQPRD